MDRRNIPWKAEWKAAGLEPGPLNPEEAELVPRLREENQAFLEKHPPEKTLRRPSRGPALLSPFWTIPMAAAAAVLLFLTVPVPGRGPASDLERMKGAGDPQLVVYRQGPGGPEKLPAGAVIRPGDVLQAAYRVSQPLQGALVSVDGDGNVTVHLAQGGRSVALTPGAERPLDFSYELDRAPRFEVFVLFTSTTPFDLEPLRTVLKKTPWDKLTSETFGPSVRFSVLALTKEVGR